jgi:hypothetical protein
MVRGLVEQQYVGRAHELSRNSKPSSLTAAQVREWPRARLDWIESQAMQDRVDSRRECVTALSVESLQIPVVTGKHGSGRCFTELPDFHGLFRERLLQRQKIRELSGGSFPHSRRGAEVAMLLEQ